MNATNPNFEPGTCSRCQQKPCLALAQSLGASLVLARNGDIPATCPLKVSPSSLNRYTYELRRFSLRQALSLSSGNGSHSFPSSISATTPPGDVIRSLHSQGKLAILAAPHGSPARKQLDSWRGAKLAGARKAQEANAAEEAAELEKEKPKPALMAPAWVWLADPKKPECEERALSSGIILEPVWCKVDSEGLMPGDSVTFSVFLKGRDGKEDLKVTTEAGRVGEGRSDDAAVAKWVIPDQIRGYKIQPKLDVAYFIARNHLHGLEVKSPDFKFTPVWKIWLQIDVDHPKAQDDELILTDESGAEVQRVKISAMKEIDKDIVELSFEDLDLTKKYTLMRDYGPDEEGGKEFLFEDLSPEVIDAIANES